MKVLHVKLYLKYKLKNNNYELTDRITVTYNTSDKVKNAIEEFNWLYQKETLATKLGTENANEEFFIDNEKGINSCFLKN